MSLADQRVFVTGATGFLGGALALRLADEGAHVRALARMPRKAEAPLKHGIEICEGDVTDAEAMRRLVEGCHTVFHAAAAMNGDYAKQRAVNVEGTRNLVRAAADADVKRFVHVSSVSVYGYRCAGDITENMPPSPGADPYALTKAEAERVVAEGNIAYTIIRPGMIYGAGAVNWTGNLFRLARLKPTPFIGDGSGSAFPIHRDDVVDLLVVAAEHPAASNQIFNCASDPAPTWREFLGAYSRLAGHQRWLALPPILVVPITQIARLASPRYSMARDMPDQLGFIQRKITYKMTKARELLGWTPRITLDTGITSCVPWLREQGLLQ